MPTPNRPHATGSLRSCLSAARRAGMRLTPAKAPGRKCEGCAAVRRIPARMVVSVTRTGRGRHYPADPSRVPVFHLAHFGTGTIDVGPAFSGRDRGRGEAAHGTCTRYLHVAARRARPTFPRTRLSPGLPGIRPPAPDPVGPAVRVAGSRGVSMRHGFAGGDKLRSHPTPEPPIPYPSGLTGRSTLIAACCSAWGYGTAGTAHPVLNSGREWALRSSRRDADERGVCPHPKHRLPSGLTGGPI